MTKTMHRWTTWWQDDLPCQFSMQRTQENAAYLVSILGESWLRRGLTSPGATNHPLLQRWLTDGAGSFLELNSLAEDLRLIESTSGVEIIIGDLLDAKQCEAAWHVIHSAALFARSDGITVAKFFPKTDRIVPDFLLRIGKKSLAVEAKILTTSEKEDTFVRYASDLCDKIFTTLYLNKLYTHQYS